MLKLMKYEFRKQLFTKFAILGIMVLLELYFFYGLLFEKENVAVSATVFLVIFAVIAILFVSFECIFTFNNDLKTKQSYMLFMVPQSTYSIMGAKVLSAIVQIILVSLFFGVVAAADLFAIAAKNGNIEDFLKMCQEFINVIFKIRVSTKEVVMVVSSIVISWSLTIILAMLSITLSTTFMANVRGRGVVSFVIFIVLNIALSKLANVLFPDRIFEMGEFLLEMLFYAVTIALSYLATAWMLNKKVSV